MAEVDFVKLMRNQKQIRNIAIAAHIDHGKTTFSDNLLAGAGMLSEETAINTNALRSVTQMKKIIDFYEGTGETI